MGYKVVVVGATGNVGKEMLNILAEREFPVDEIAALASRKSMGTEISFGDKTLKTKDLDTFDFTGWDIALFAVGSEATKLYAPRAAAAGISTVQTPWPWPWPCSPTESGVPRSATWRSSWRAG